jgi:hypothetical protein
MYLDLPLPHQSLKPSISSCGLSKKKWTHLIGQAHAWILAQLASIEGSSKFYYSPKSKISAVPALSHLPPDYLPQVFWLVKLYSFFLLVGSSSILVADTLVEGSW